MVTEPMYSMHSTIVTGRATQVDLILGITEMTIMFNKLITGTSHMVVIRTISSVLVV